MTRYARIARRALALGVVAGIAPAVMVATVGATEHAPAHAHRLVVPVDRQDYVADVSTTNPSDGSTVDPYDADPSSLHVAINAGSEFARSFVRLALDYLPRNARATDAVMTLHLTAQSDASNTGVYPIYNIDTSAAIVSACVLKTELPSDFDPSKPPAYDCPHGSAVGKPNKAGDAWTFDLKALLPYWRTHGNTGAALVPVGTGDPTQTWGIAFYKSRSTSAVAFDRGVAPVARHAHGHGGSSAPPSGPNGGSSSGSTASTSTSQSSGQAHSSLSSTAATTTPTGSGTGAPPAIAGSTTAPVTVPVNSTGGGSPTWPWVLLASLLVAAGAVGAAHRERLLELARRIGPVGIALYRTHPHAYAVASVAAVWGLVFTGYSVVVEPSHPATTEASADTGSSGTSDSTGTTGSTSAGQTAAAAAGGATSPAGAAGVAGAAGSAATSTTGGGAATSAANPAAHEFSGRGSWRTINGVRVFFPADGSTPIADLYHGADDTIGITPNTIKVCAHAALTYGSAFHISASDLNVYWQWLNDHGGIFGRKIETNYQNDNYDPGTAVQAAQACKDWGTFMLLGGIGFDQIPAVRQWAEQNHMLYLHHVATTENTAGLRYSFSALPSVEDLGKQMGELAAWKFRGKKVGIIYRNSSNWSPGVKTFEQVVRAAGMQVVGSYPVTINQGNYTTEISRLQAQGAQVVFCWENALSDIEILKQAQGQNYHPAWLLAAFNIITNTLGKSSFDQDMWGAAAWDAYDHGYAGGGYSSYAGDIKEFEREYAQYDPGADLGGDGGDLLFDTWESWRFLADLLKRCGPDCTRNKMAGLLLAGYHHTVPPNCDVNFSRTSDHHHGGYLFNTLHVVKDPNGRPAWMPVQRCVPLVGPGV
jgi:hypothetical protein